MPDSSALYSGDCFRGAGWLAFLFPVCPDRSFRRASFLDGTKSRFGRKVAAGEDSGSGRGMIVFLGAAATVLMWAAVLYTLR